MAESFLTPLCRTAFPVLKEPKVAQNGKGKAKYSTCMIFDPAQFSPKDKTRMKAIKQACIEALRQKFGDAAFDKKTGKPKAAYWPFRDAAEKDHLGGFEDGMVFANARTEIQPGIADARDGKTADGKWPEAEDPTDCYPGCYSRVKVQVYAYDMEGNKGVALGLGNIIIMKDGERLDGSVDASSDFGDIDDDELFDEDDDDTSSDDDDDDMI